MRPSRGTLAAGPRCLANEMQWEGSLIWTRGAGPPHSHADSHISAAGFGAFIGLIPGNAVRLAEFSYGRASRPDVPVASIAPARMLDGRPPR
jgi:hypothetical protein